MAEPAAERQRRLEAEAALKIAREDSKDLRTAAVHDQIKDSKKGFRGFIQRFFAGGLLTKSSDEWLD